MRSATPRLTAGGRDLLFDVVPVVVLGLLAVFTGEADRPRADVAVILIVVLPLALRRRWPLPVLAIVAIGVVATAMDAAAPWVLVGSVALASFEVGRRATDRIQSAVAVLIVAGLVTLAFVLQEADPIEVLAITFAALVPAWLAGDIIRTRRVEGLRRAEAMERAQREREDQARAAAAEERRHVARELHDVVAHAVSVMVVQAGAARQVMDASPDRAQEAMLAVEATGREAMTELRQFLGTLRDDDEPAGVAPQPGIAELDSLVERVRAAGLPASLEVDGEPSPVSASLDVAVFRIVQEALTNALRYAMRASTLVRLSWEPEQLRLEILDEGPAATDPGGSGRGLAGMRERASLVGGHLEAGPRVGGGYAVRAWLPLQAPAVGEPAPP
jgi:signal transduction histidine kinase